MLYVVDVFSGLNTVDDDDITNCCKCRHLIADSVTLPCLDSLCAKCFRELCDAYRNNSEGVAKCPRCDDQFPLPTTDSAALPDHRFIDTLIALKKIANQNPEDDNCDICKQLATDSEPIAAAEYYCIECHQTMCASCARPHTVFPSCKNHNVVGLGVDSANQVVHMRKSVLPMCAIHKDIHATTRCYECRLWLCSQCQNFHSKHELETLTDDTHSQLTNKVKCLIDKLHQDCDDCKEWEDRVQKLLLDRRNGVELAVKEINETADEMLSIIQKQRDDLLNRLRSRNNQTISTLETVSGSLSLGLSSKRYALRFAGELLEKGSVEDFLLNYRMLNDRVTRLHDMFSECLELDDNVCHDVSPTSLIHDVCTSLDTQSKICLLTWCY